MFSSPYAPIAAYAALQAACRHAAEQDPRADALAQPARALPGRWIGVLAGVAVSLSLLQTVVRGAGPVAPHAEAAAPFENA